MRLALTTHHRSWLVPVGVLAALIFGVSAIGGAGAATSTKAYFAEIDQIAQNSYTFVLTNHETSTQTLGSANVSVPSGFSDVSVPPFATADAGKTWTSVLKDGVIELRAATTKSALAPRQSVSVTITGTAGCGGSPYTWATRVKQSNSFSGLPGNDFVGNQPSVSVIGPPSAFVFDAIASPQVVDASFDVSVTAEDACENAAVFYTGDATISGLADATDGTKPTYDTLSFTSGDGTASGSVTAVQSELLATLTATNGAATGPASNEFDVVDAYCDTSVRSCHASHDDGTRVFAPVPPPGAVTKLSLSGPGKSFTCGGRTYANIGSHVTVDPEYPEGETAPIQIVIEWSLATAPPGSRVICMTKDDATFVVPRCGRTPEPPCELDRTRSGDVLRTTILIAPQDPGFDFG